MRRRRMHGTILLLAIDRGLPVHVDQWRARGLTVYDCEEFAHALKQFEHIAPDASVAMLSAHDSASIIPVLTRHGRSRHLDHRGVRSRTA